MNINLREVICTSKVSLQLFTFILCVMCTQIYSQFHQKDGDKFWRMPECYIRGSTIKYLRIPDEVIDMVKEDAQVKSRQGRQDMKGRGGPNQRGGNRGGNQGGNRPQRGGRQQQGGGNMNHKKPKP